MKNLEMYGVHRMDIIEMKKTDGGGIIVSQTEIDNAQDPAIQDATIKVLKFLAGGIFWRLF